MPCILLFGGLVRVTFINCVTCTSCTVTADLGPISDDKVKMLYSTGPYRLGAHICLYLNTAHQYGTMPSHKHRPKSLKPYRNEPSTSFSSSPGECHIPTCYLHQILLHWLVVETNYLLSFFSLKITNPASCLHHFLPRRDPIQLHLGLDHTNTTQDPPPVQNATAHSFNIAFLTISLGFRIDRNVIIITLNCLYVCMYLFYSFYYCIALYCSIHLFSYCCKYANKSSSSSHIPFLGH